MPSSVSGPRVKSTRYAYIHREGRRTPWGCLDVSQPGGIAHLICHTLAEQGYARSPETLCRTHHFVTSRPHRSSEQNHLLRTKSIKISKKAKTATQTIIQVFRCHPQNL